MKKSILSLLFVFSLIFWEKASCQNGINYLKIQYDINRVSCRFNVDTLYLTMRRLYILKDVKIDKGLAEYYYDCGVALHIYGIINRCKTATLKSNEYMYKCIHNGSKSKGDAYNYLTWNYSVLKDCEKTKKSLNLYIKYTPKEHLQEDFIKMINEKCR